jgi:hypothetical protein
MTVGMAVPTTVDSKAPKKSPSITPSVTVFCWEGVRSTGSEIVIFEGASEEGASTDDCGLLIGRESIAETDQVLKLGSD